ncbi:hypothetical protein CN918_25530 [Priestia megaterium]|nr:hypothetical protein CN918_25530 [Priestia megaterium]
MLTTPVKEISRRFVLMPYQLPTSLLENKYGTLVMDTPEGPTVYAVSHQTNGLYFDVDPLSTLDAFDFSSLHDERTVEIYKAISILNSVVVYLEIVEKEREAVRYITTIQDKKSEFFEYLLLDKQFLNYEDSAGSISLDVHVDTSSSPKTNLSVKEYHTYLFYRVIHEIGGLCKAKIYPYTRDGFLDALRSYRHEVHSFSFQKTS